MVRGMVRLHAASFAAFWKKTAPKTSDLKEYCGSPARTPRTETLPGWGFAASLPLPNTPEAHQNRNVIMKITVEIDCTPDEARHFAGLPDVVPMQQAII